MPKIKFIITKQRLSDPKPEIILIAEAANLISAAEELEALKSKYRDCAIELYLKV